MKTKNIILGIPLIFLFCNVEIVNISVKNFAAVDVHENWKNLSNKKIKIFNDAWRNRKRISELGSPNFAFYQNTDHKIIQIEFNNGEVVKIEVSGTLISFNGKFYRLKIDTSFYDIPQK